MSIKIMSAIWDIGPDKQGHLLVLLAIADFADDTGLAWPSMRRIAEKSRMEERSAQRIVRQLEADGWLSIATGGGRSGCNQYRVNPDNQTPTESHPDNMSPRPKQHKPRPKVQETLTDVSPEPLRTIKEPSKGKTGLIEMMSEVLSLDVAVAFFEHRKHIKKPLSEHSTKLLIAELKKMPDADAAANRSILAGYPSVYPDSKGGKSFAPKQDQISKWERMGR